MIRYYMSCASHELTKGSEGAAAYDIRVDQSDRIINPGERWKISTGLYLAMPKGVYAQMSSRSGLALHHGIVVAQAPAIIDSDYRGEVFVTLLNVDRQTPYEIKRGDRIAQMVFLIYAGSGVVPGEDIEQSIWQPPVRVASIEELGMTDRGSGGHGSTGR